MDAILGLLGAGASVASGGIFGFAGAIFSSWQKGKQMKLEMAERGQDRVHEKEMFRLNMEAKSQEGSWSAMTATHEADAAIAQQENYKWVRAIKTLFRPALTAGLWVAVGWQLTLILSGALTTYVDAAISKQAIFSPTDIVELVRYIVYSTVFSATTATTWWFGERALTMPNMKNR